jgi:hypothetical protein
VLNPVMGAAGAGPGHSSSLPLPLTS